ncbi:Aldo/keto reductase [Flagelloscypha sp. PMI_526]|nr:Aldo/keto reductase [Flagelloscypha sp. PMI_526]
MSYQTLTLNDGREIPEIGFGTGTAWYGREATKAVVEALESGFVHLDTAQWYDNEESVGDAISRGIVAREKVWVTTKFGGGDIETEFQKSLTKLISYDQLQLDAVDLYLIHFPKYTPDIGAGWKKFEELQERGLAKSIGVSNFTIQDLQILLKTAKVKPAVNQVRFHPYNYSENKELLEFASAHGIIIQSYGTLNPLTKEAGGPLDPILQRIATRIGGTPAQVIFLWARQKGVVVVTTTVKKERMDEYLTTPQLPPLTPEDIADIDTAGKK